MANTKECLVCGKVFEACNTCRKDIDENMQWRRVVCCPEHFQYHLPIIQFINKKIDKQTAKAQLTEAIEKYGEIEFWNNIKDVVAEIFTEEKTVDENTNRNKRKKK